VHFYDQKVKKMYSPHSAERQILTHGRYNSASQLASPGAAWPGGKRLAVYIAIGIEEYDFGEGRTENLMHGVAAPDLVNSSWRDYGNRVGAQKLLQRLARFGIPPTVLLNTALYEAAPHVVALARTLNSEFIGHGVSNSDILQGMDEPQERAYLQRVFDSMTKHEGQTPLGWSSPWLAHTPNTLDLLGTCGYRYVMDLRLDDRPVWLNTASTPLLAMPYALELNDSTSIIDRHISASEFADMVIDEFDELLEASQEYPLVMSVVLHSFISGAPFRLRQLSRALAHMQAKADAVWFTQPRAIYRAVTEKTPP
jgi:peptidoglycan/xylan/chitin deacetylase (PgdA/CDA1 family)